MRSAAIVVTLALALPLAGCGFRLQGAAPLPAGVDDVRIVHQQPYRVAEPPLVLILERRLRARGALGGADAGAVLRIAELNSRRRLLAVSPEDARGAVYELETEVVFDFLVDGETRLTHESLTVRREYSVDDTARLAAEAEREDLIEAMHAELANLILLALATRGEGAGRTSLRDRP